MAQESYVGVAPDASGKKIRNLSAYALQSDGTIALVQMQVVALVDAITGLPVSVDSASAFEQMLTLMRQQTALLQTLVVELTDIDPTDDLTDELDEIIEGVA